MLHAPSIVRAAFIAILFFPFALLAQHAVPGSTAIINWTTDPFENKVFIENKGQFDGSAPDGETVLFGVRNEGAEIFFTSKGVTWKRDELVESKGKTAHETEKKEKRKKRVSHYSKMEWTGANANAEIIAEEKVSRYFTYSNLRDASGTTGIHADAYKRITYKNIYPNIDLEYIFPEGKPGMKYSFIVRPGGDASLIRMHYPDARSLSLDENGNLQVLTGFGTITDHAPVSFEKGGGKIRSSFMLTGNTVTFKMGAMPSNKTVIIDPWTTTPVFTGTNKAYDLCYDNLGNVYIYGGEFPYQVSKLNSSGAIQWTFTTTAFTNASYPCAGDFAVDELTGTSYIGEGFNGMAGSGLLKVNTGGVQVGFYPGLSSFNEMWRMAYNSCVKTIVIGGGGTNDPYQAAVLDTTLTTLTPVNVLSANMAFHDIALLAIGSNNSCYMATARSFVMDPANFDNTLLSVPLPTLIPPVYMVPDGHSFIEANSITYAANNMPNGFNGMAVGGTFLYTFDGALVKKWDPANGASLGSSSIGSAPFNWGGLAADVCNNFYAGVQNTVKMYDASFNLVNTLNMPNTVYDVMIDGTNLYACGNGFVTSAAMPSGGCDPVTCSGSPPPPPPPGGGGNPPCNDFEPAGYSNVFSPNGDSKNDVFYPFVSNLTPAQIEGYAASYSLQVFNRWGEKVYDSGTYSQGWNGKDPSGKELSNGVYYWIMTYKVECSEKEITETGFVHLMR
jgi:gliding motility-associated-like protein